MKTRCLAACLALAAICGVRAAGESPASAAAASTGIQRAAWLAGCWEWVADGRTVEEHWMAPRGKNMINVARTMRGDTLVEYEVVIVREEGDRLAYEAHPAGQPAAVFVSKTVTERALVFENLEHDFPQRVAYERSGDSLLAWIEGMRGGRTERIEFPYKRVACPGKQD